MIDQYHKKMYEAQGKVWVSRTMVDQKTVCSITRREPRERRVWLILEVAALFFSIGRQHPHGGGWWLLGCVTAAGAKAVRHWDRAFRRRSKMEHAQRGLD